MADQASRNNGEKLKVAVIGSTGYGGVELVRLLLAHPRAEIVSVLSSSQEGALFSDAYPHLTHIVPHRLEAIDPAGLAAKAELVFTATPHGVSASLVPRLLDAGLKVIDLSGDFRLKDGAVYEAWYNHKPADGALLKEAVYGLAEVYGSDVRGARLVSNPGCYATTMLLGLVPAVAAGWVDPGTIIVDAKSGVSGAGRGLSMNVHFSEVNENLKAYKVNCHQHVPEAEQVLSQAAGRPVTITFTPHLAPMTRGILAASYAALTERAARDEAQWIELYRQYYEGRPFVRIRDKGVLPATKDVYGSNYCDIGFSLDRRTGRITIISVTDNLVKGAAGQAVQNMNLMMGWDETLGLRLSPVYP